MSQALQKQDMGSGSVKKLMLQMALPAVVGQLVNLLYNIVDRIYIGRMEGVGELALAGVGLVTPIITLITAFSLLCGSGGAPRAAIAMGRGDRESAEKTMGNCFTMLMILAAVLTVVFYACAPSLLRWFGASDATLGYALDYSRIYILGTVFVMTVLGTNTFITAQGFSKFSMLTTVIGAVVNIVLDPIFIFALGMGVKGAALATVISQAVSALWVLKFLTGKKTVLKLRLSQMRLRRRVILPCLGLGVSSFTMIATESILAVSFTNRLSLYGGDIAVGAMTVLNSINQLISLPMQGICQGGQPLISFNYGAGKFDRVKQAFRLQFVSCVAYGTVFWALVMLFPRFFAGIFTDNAALADYTAWAMRIYLGGICSLGFQLGCQQAFVALGQAKISLAMACLRKLVLLIPLIFILPCFFGWESKSFAVFLAEPISDIAAAIVTTSVFFWKFKKLLKTS